MKKRMGCGTVIGAVISVFFILNWLAGLISSSGVMQFFIIVGVIFLIIVYIKFIDGM